MSKIWYSIFVDDEYVGITDDEDECWEIAERVNNGETTLFDDDVDRVQICKIDVNRFFYDYHKYTNDKLSNKSILCRTEMECKNAVEQLNALNLAKERLEAKLRAMAL